MQVRSLYLKNFRCFEQLTIDFDARTVLITGINGTGKSSLLEALHYACYLRSFRTHIPRDLISIQEKTFFIKISCIADSGTNHDVQIGFSRKKRLIKIDEKIIKSYKELTDYYRVVTITEDDLMLIKEGPETRRLFLDQALMLHEPNYLSAIRTYKNVLYNRNVLLNNINYDKESFDIWTLALWERSSIIRKDRVIYLEKLHRTLNDLIVTYFEKKFSLECAYHDKVEYGDSYDSFVQKNIPLFQQERLYKRSLFGIHLDDFTIHLRERTAKTFASRGQQKLIVFLIKIAQIKQLNELKGKAVVLIDDFMTDFDEATFFTLLTVLNDLDMQIIFTSPTHNTVVHDRIIQYGGTIVKLPL